MVKQAAKNAGVGQGIKEFTVSHSTVGGTYSITIDYDPKFFSKSYWVGDEQNFAYGDTYHLAESFVRLLVKDGIDPSFHGDAQIISVCGRMAGPKSVTGHRTVYHLGCSEYTPLTDSVSMNSHMH